MSPRGARTLAAAFATLLTVTALGPLFRPGEAWIVPVVAALVVAAACGALGRRTGLPSVLVPLLTPLGLVGVVTAVGSPGDALLGVIPTRATLTSLHTLVTAGFADVRDYATPVPATPGLVLLTVAGVYVVAALVDLLAVTAGRPVLAGLPLLALFGVPAAVLSHGVGFVHFALAAGGWVLLLALDGRERLVRWGRVLGRPASAGPEGLLLGGAAGRVAGISLAVAVAVPLLLPALGSGLLRGGSGGLGGNGSGGSVTVVPPLVTVKARLRDSVALPLFDVTTTRAEYYRLTALDAFDGSQFTLVQDSAEADRRVDGPLSPTPGLDSGVPTDRIEAELRVGGALAEPYLPLPYSPVSVRISGRWQLAPHLRTIFSLRDTTRGRTITVTAQAPRPTGEQLRAHPRAFAGGGGGEAERRLRADTALPATIAPIVARTASQVTAGRRTDYDRLLALQAFFTGGAFTYDTTATVDEGNAGLTAFLRDRRGYCEQFASVFTLMARSLGIPARVAVGFTPGTAIAAGVYRVTTKDAHAWPEVWFDNVGWVRFEPTPRSDLGAEPGYLQAAGAPAEPKAAPALPSAAATPSTGASSRVRDALEPDRGTPRDLAPLRSRDGWSGRSLLVLATVLAIIVIALLPAAARVELRRRRVRTARAGGTPGAAPPSYGETGAASGADAAAGADTASGAGAAAGAGAAGRRVPAAVAAAAAHAAWQELLDTVVDLRLPLQPSDSPRSTGRRLAELLPRRPDRDADEAGDTGGVRPAGDLEVVGQTAPGRVLRWGPEVAGRRRGQASGAGQALIRLTAAEERARYAAVSGDVDLPAGVGVDAVLVRRALLAGQPRGVRMRAALLPASLLGRLRERVAGAADVASATAGRVGGAVGGRLRGWVARRS